MSNQIVLPRILQVGANASEAIPDVLSSLGCSRPLIITDKMMVQLGYAGRIQDVLATKDMSADVFADTVPEPTVDSIRAGVEHTRSGDYDSIIALGGGSPIDSAKAIGILAKYGGEMRDYKFPRQVSEQGLPIIAVPTTAGTGSEVTRFTIITDEKNDEKMLCVGIGFYARGGIGRLHLDALPASTCHGGYRYRCANPRHRGLCQPQSQPLQ